MNLTMRHQKCCLTCHDRVETAETVHRSTMATMIDNECLPATDTILMVRQSTMGSLLHHEAASICTAHFIN